MTLFFSTLKKCTQALLAALPLVLISPAALSYTVDTASSPMTGLWNNDSEPGWGAAITQQYGMIFATVYTYDANGNPTWYVASSCPVSGDGCTGDLYKVAGGSPLTASWNGAAKNVVKAGFVNFAFTDGASGAMRFTIDGVSASKAITKAHFADPVSASTLPKLSSTPIRLDQNSTLGTANTWPNGDTASGGQGATIDGIVCATMEGTQYHVHAHLAIIKDGQFLAVPSSIGITNKCLYEMHTHNASGEIHIESFTQKRFTLGQLFAIWGQPLSYSNIAGLTGLPVVAYINDGATVQRYDGNLADIELTSHRSVTLQVGAALNEIPTYVWDTTQ